MLTGIPISNQFFTVGIEILLGVAKAFGKSLGRWSVENLHSRSRTFIHFNSIKPRIFVEPSWTNTPHLTRWQGITTDVIFALQFRRDDEFLHAFLVHLIAEMSVAKFCCSNSLLLFLNTTATFQRQAHRPFQALVRHGFFQTRMYQLQQPADGPLHRG